MRRQRAAVHLQRELEEVSAVLDSAVPQARQAVRGHPEAERGGLFTADRRRRRRGLQKDRPAGVRNEGRGQGWRTYRECKRNKTK